MPLSARSRSVSLMFCGALLFMIPALYNGFPIVTNDTGTYLSSGFGLEAPVDRPVFYGLFIRASSLGVSLWLTVFAQCLLLCFVLLRLVRSWIPRMPDAHKLLLILFSSVCTVGGWYAGQLMPDIFVPIMVLAVLVYLRPDTSRRERWVMLGIALLALLTHNSNYITLTLFAAVLLAASLVVKRLRPLRSRVPGLIGSCAVAWVLLCSSNYIGRKSFTASNATHVFLMGKLVESGVLKTYLDKACPLRDYRICPFKDSLPAVAYGFVWDGNSPLQRTGGWDANRDEYNTIILDIASRPKYWPYLAWKSAEASLRQLVLINIDGVFELPWVKYLEDSPPYESVRKYMPHELNGLRASRQNNNSLDVKYMNGVYPIVFIALALFALFAEGTRPDRELWRLATPLFALILLNAFTTATFANVLTRLNSRLIWLLPVFCAIVIYRCWSFRIRSEIP